MKENFLKLLRSFFAGIFILALMATFAPENTVARVMEGDDCHEEGYCTDICGVEETTACTYMDCGSGTQLCMRSN